MSYKISVPLTHWSDNRESILRELDKLGASRVFLCPGRGLDTPENKASQLNAISEGLDFFQQHGYETGVWISTIGHGGSLAIVTGDEPFAGYTNIVGVTGESSTDSFCPLDPGFSNAVCDWVEALARAGAKMIMLDDDYRMSNRGGVFGCLCERHLSELSRRVGEPLNREEVLEKIYCGGENKYRSAWLDMMGDTLREFSRQIRSAADRVSEDIRVGACSCMSVWDGDGVDSMEISEILAGKTKPFMRLIGAPYWGKSQALSVFCRLGYVIELERMQLYWCNERDDIEIFAEGDVYPRPRYIVPSAYLEGFDTAIRADGRSDGILKYAIDYTSSPTYESGYALRAQRNKPIYTDIDRFFSGKSAVGVRVICTMNKLRTAEFPDHVLSADHYNDYSFFQPEQAFLCDNSIPAAYDCDGDCACVCFGENARHIKPSELLHGAVIDVPAAQILASRGIDTGIINATPLTSPVSCEFFPDENERVNLSDNRGLYSVEPSRTARSLSQLVSGDSSFPSVYEYENTNNRRFLVMCADMSAGRSNERYRRSYCRQRQVINAIERLQGSSLPAVCPGNPDLYIMCKSDGKKLSVGLWNFFEDSVIDPVITLGEEYTSAEFVNCGGSVEGRTIKLDGDIPAYGFSFFDVG